MERRYKTWRSPVAIMLLFIAGVVLVNGCKAILFTNSPAGTPELLADVTATLLGVLLFAIPARILFRKERAIKLDPA